MKKLRVLLADDHRLAAEGLKSLLEPHFDVVGIVADGRELLSAASALRPDAIVLDIHEEASVKTGARRSRDFPDIGCDRRLMSQ